MDKHIEKAMQLRSNAMCPNCAETIMMTYAEELGLSESQMKALGTNFGGGMKSGSTCGAVTGALMVLVFMKRTTSQPTPVDFDAILHSHLPCSDIFFHYCKYIHAYPNSSPLAFLCFLSCVGGLTHGIPFLLYIRCPPSFLFELLDNLSKSCFPVLYP